MMEQQQSLKQPAKVALAALAVLLIGSVVFYRERILFADASFIAFNILNYNDLSIQEHRFGSFITQIVPYLGQKMHLPVRAVLLGYSVSFNLFYFTVASILVYRHRQYGLAILMALYYFLFVSDSYFWTNNEIHQAVAWMFLFFGATISMGNKNTKTPILITLFTLLAFLTVFTHFVVIIPVLFLWLYFLIDKTILPFSMRMLITLTCILIVTIAAKFTLSLTQPYDGSHLHGVTHFSIKDVLLTFTTHVVSMFAYRVVTIYWPAFIVLIPGVISLITNKKKNLLIWTLVSIIGYFIVMGLTYGGYDDNFELFHVESEWASITVIMGAPFIFSYLPRLSTKNAMILLAAVFLIRIGYISASIPVFKWRSEFKEQVMTQMKKKGITKLALYEEGPLREKLLIDWALAEESLLASAMAGDNPQISFRFVNKDNTDLINSLNNPNGISFCFTWLQPMSFNKTYFKLDTVTQYKVMTYPELMK